MVERPVNEELSIFVLAYIAQQRVAHWSDIFCEYNHDKDVLYVVPPFGVETLLALQEKRLIYPDRRGYYRLDTKTEIE